MSHAGAITRLNARYSAFLAKFPFTVYVQRKADTKDAGGGNRTAWVNVTGTPLSCLWSKRKGEVEQPVGDSFEGAGPYYFLLPTNADVTEADRLKLNAVMYGAVTIPEQIFEIEHVGRGPFGLVEVTVNKPGRGR